MRARPRVARAQQLVDEPAHLLVRERHVDLDGGAAREARGDLLSNRFERGPPPPALDRVEQLREQRARVAGGQLGRNRRDRDRPAREREHVEAGRLQLRLQPLEGDGLSRGEVDRLGQQELLARGRRVAPRVAEPLEEDPLVRDVLVDEQQPLLVRRHDEALADLAERADVAAQLARAVGHRRLVDDGQAPVRDAGVLERGRLGDGEGRRRDGCWRRLDRLLARAAVVDVERGLDGPLGRREELGV